MDLYNKIYLYIGNVLLEMIYSYSNGSNVAIHLHIVIQIYLFFLISASE
jgi:hypothetical protein